VRNADGTTKIISETVTQPINQPAPTPTPQNTPQKPDQPQKIQVMRTADGKMSVRGLQPNQKLVQTSDGKYLILPSNSNGEQYFYLVLGTYSLFFKYFLTIIFQILFDRYFFKYVLAVIFQIFFDLYFSNIF